MFSLLLAIIFTNAGFSLRFDYLPEEAMAAIPKDHATDAAQDATSTAPDWRAVVRQIAVSRALDDMEETRLLPERKVLYQFSARGHDVTQVLLGRQLTGARDGVGAYYRSRPLLLTLGLSVDEALAATMMRAGGNERRPRHRRCVQSAAKDGACVLPVCGGVGTQYTPAVGWAQALRYRQSTLGDTECADSIAVVHGGDASTATNGFWAALNIVTTERLPLLFFIEDNGMESPCLRSCRLRAATLRRISPHFAA